MWLAYFLDPFFFFRNRWSGEWKTKRRMLKRYVGSTTTILSTERIVSKRLNYVLRKLQFIILKLFLYSWTITILVYTTLYKLLWGRVMTCTRISSPLYAYQEPATELKTSLVYSCNYIHQLWCLFFRTFSDYYILMLKC